MSEDQDMPVRSRPIMERHIQTVLLSVIVAALLWFGSSVVEVREGFARQDEKMIGVQSQLAQIQADLRSQSDKYYPRADAEREMTSFRSDIRTLRERVTVLEGKDQ
ncbi:hypothetical protein AAGT95_16760 [Salinicola lusitanus]|uniref:Uncharacterized protein n=1 Tax=Salinicola lusitanus TaxID=1949085 RepID=A0ABZ3CQL4_9GAMM